MVRVLADRYDVDVAADCKRLVMNWDELRDYASDPLVTIGAHTKGHFAIAKLAEERALDEMAGSADRIEKELGTRPIHFSFPYGDPGSASPRDFAICEALGLETAVTTHKDVLREKYAITGLPRASLNGDFQHPTYVAAMLTGVPFMAFDAAQALSRAVWPRPSRRERPANGGSVPAPHPGAAST